MLSLICPWLHIWTTGKGKRQKLNQPYIYCNKNRNTLIKYDRISRIQIPAKKLSGKLNEINGFSWQCEENVSVISTDI